MQVFQRVNKDEDDKKLATGATCIQGNSSPINGVHTLYKHDDHEQLVHSRRTPCIFHVTATCFANLNARQS